MGKVPYMDQSGLYALEDLLLRLNRKGVVIVLVNLQQQPRVMMEKIDIIPDLVANERIFDSFKETMKYIKANVKDIA